MNSIVRSVLAVLAGALYGAVIAIVVIAFGSFFIRPPQDAGPASLENPPAAVCAVVLIGWAVGAFGGAWLAGFTARCQYVGHSLVVGVVLLVGMIFMLQMMHAAWWWCLIGLPAFPLACWLGAQLAERVVQKRVAEAAAKKAAAKPPVPSDPV